jgi:hypothetical protein
MIASDSVRPQPDLNYRDTFILVAADCKAVTGVVPPPKAKGKSVAEIQYALLAARPYGYTQEEILFESHIQRSGIGTDEIDGRRRELWDTFFSKPMACLRASPLPKTYGWGIHFDGAGRAALYACDSAEYRHFAMGRDGGPKLLNAMRNKRALKP